VRFKGEILPPQDGSYRVGLTGDDGFRLKLRGKTLLEDWSNHAAESRSAVIQAKAGEPIPFEVEYFENGGQARIALGWEEAKDSIQDAAALAAKADAAVVFAGLTARFESEGSDRQDFALPGKQNELISAVAKANSRTVVVMESGSPVDMEPWVGQVGAVLQAWFPGMEGGNALAELLLGGRSPSGKLPVSFPKRLSDVPSQKNFPGNSKEVRYAEGLMVGYRHYDSNSVEPRFPFGHGLSYSKFEYSEPSYRTQGDAVLVSFMLKNSGSMEAAEVAQLYVRPHKSAFPRPLQELKAFEKVKLKPGELRKLTLMLPLRAFQYWSPKLKDWVLESGAYQLALGSSSRDIRLSLEIKAPF
jgi:beta-glucosidase